MQTGYDTNFSEIKANKRPTQEIKRPENNLSTARLLMNKKKNEVEFSTFDHLSLLRFAQK